MINSSGEEYKIFHEEFVSALTSIVLISSVLGEGALGLWLGDDCKDLLGDVFGGICFRKFVIPDEYIDFLKENEYMFDQLEELPPLSFGTRKCDMSIAECTEEMKRFNSFSRSVFEILISRDFREKVFSDFYSAIKSCSISDMGILINKLKGSLFFDYGATNGKELNLESLLEKLNFWSALLMFNQLGMRLNFKKNFKAIFEKESAKILSEYAELIDADFDEVGE